MRRVAHQANRRPRHSSNERAASRSPSQPNVRKIFQCGACVADPAHHRARQHVDPVELSMEAIQHLRPVHPSRTQRRRCGVEPRRKTERARDAPQNRVVRDHGDRIIRSTAIERHAAPKVLRRTPVKAIDVGDNRVACRLLVVGSGAPVGDGARHDRSQFPRTANDPRAPGDSVSSSARTLANRSA